MDYGNNYTTSYGAQGGGGGGGFMPGSQGGESGGAKRTYGKETLRPVTIKQLLDAQQSHADAEFVIDGAEASQITFVGQVRNISAQTTNVTYKIDDGTGIMEVKVWIDKDAANNPEHPSHSKPKPVEQGYARVWGRFKDFNNKRHVAANIVRPVTDFNEVQYHLLEATVVHLHFTRGPPESLQQGKGDANGAANGQGGGVNGHSGGGGDSRIFGASKAARRVFECIKETPQMNEGLHMQDIATRTGLDVAEVGKAGDELQNLGLVYTTVDDHTWAILDV